MRDRTLLDPGYGIDGPFTLDWDLSMLEETLVLMAQGIENGVHPSLQESAKVLASHWATVVSEDLERL